MSPSDAKIFASVPGSLLALTPEVRNLPADIKEKEVKYIFSKYGSVRATDAQGSDVCRRSVVPRWSCGQGCHLLVGFLEFCRLFHKDKMEA